MRKKWLLIQLYLFVLWIPSLAQPGSVLFGHITDSAGHPIDLANVSIRDSQVGTMTGENGYYELAVSSGEEVELLFSCVGYLPEQKQVTLMPGERKELDVVLATNVESLSEVSVSARQERASTFQRINLEELNYMPSTTGKVEAVIKSQAGVSSNNELTSQYSVRGGNFDENLVYVNDIEIYRPFLVRSGEQEGLSFINSDLVSSIRFSAGGYNARYGDKMSSALDITYRRPTRFAGSASISLLGASVHLEGASRNQRFTFLSGYRYKTTSYLLNTLQTSGDYKPQFADYQMLMTYRFSSKVALSFLGNYSSNKYQFIPETRNTEFGTNELPFNLKIYYDGQEVDQFNTYLGALSLDIKPTQNLNLKFIASGFQTNEQETYDIQGQYLINELDNTAGSETYGDSILNIGIGTLLSHARNYLDAYVLSGSHLGTWNAGSHHLKWGVKYQYQDFYDRINEWELIDSAGYSLPYSGERVSVQTSSRSETTIQYDLFNAFLQDTWEVNTPAADYFFTSGLRGSLWNYNRTFMVSPRLTFSMQPAWERDMMFHLSWGYYYQPPFYKEMRLPNDQINTEIKPQRSIHLLAGGDYIFNAWDRPFKLTAEVYYKWLNDLIPYKIENVRIQYAGENLAKGYATGLDLKINGEFVPGAQSWLTASLLQTKENITGDSILVYNQEGEQVMQEAGYYARPTEQLLTVGLFFQDYLPSNPDYKVHLSAFYGTGLPLSHPDEGRYYTELRMRPYRRVDIGFSKALIREGGEKPTGKLFRFFNSVWISGEVFNLLGINNEASYIWIKTISNQQGVPGRFGVPNYLTGRRFNIKINAKF